MTINLETSKVPKSDCQRVKKVEETEVSTHESVQEIQQSRKWQNQCRQKP